MDVNLPGLSCVNSQLQHEDHGFCLWLEEVSFHSLLKVTVFATSSLLLQILCEMCMFMKQNKKTTSFRSLESKWC